MERKNIYREVNEMLAFCEDCFVQKHFRKEKGRAFAHQFCLSNCTVGQKLKKVGKKLTKCD